MKLRLTFFGMLCAAQVVGSFPQAANATGRKGLFRQRNGAPRRSAPWAKICGVKSVAEARTAVTLGANAVGLLIGQVHPSDDFISKARGRAIVRSLPPGCTPVMVTHLRDPKRIVDLARYTKVKAIQLHGGSTVREILQIRSKLPGIRIYRTFHVTDESVLQRTRQFERYVDGIVLDSYNSETTQVGGTGKTHDWRISQQVVRSARVPVILAGGLTPDNVRRAIHRVRPFGVDVNSGVKNARGLKSPTKVKRFLGQVKRQRRKTRVVDTPAR